MLFAKCCKTEWQPPCWLDLMHKDTVMPTPSSAATGEGEDASLAKPQQSQTGYTRYVPRKPNDCF